MHEYNVENHEEYDELDYEQNLIKEIVYDLIWSDPDDT